MTLNYLGYMLADRNTHLEEALTLIKRAIDLDPQNGAYLDSLGWAYFKLGNYDQAEENLRRAADKTPNDATVQDHLGELYARTNRFKLAAAHWERALDEWNKSVPADVDQQDVTRVTKKLESTKVKLAQQTEQQK
jgi:tetratricopeptide (TPR) repeat protein